MFLTGDWCAAAGSSFQGCAEAGAATAAAVASALWAGGGGGSSGGSGGSGVSGGSGGAATTDTAAPAEAKSAQLQGAPFKAARKRRHRAGGRVQSSMSAFG